MPTTSPAAVSGGVVGEVGDAEVHQLRPRLAVLDHLHVLGLDVAVDDAARVGVVERLAEVGADLADLAVGELAGVGEAGQGRALDQLGDEQRVAVLLPQLVEGDDAGVVEPGRGLGLAQDPPAGLAPLLDRLHRHRALEAAVPGLVDDAEAAAADAALDQEAVEHEGADQSSSHFAGQRLPLLRAAAGKNAPFAASPGAPAAASVHTLGQQPAWRRFLEDSPHAARAGASGPQRRPERQQIMLRRGARPRRRPGPR